MATPRFCSGTMHATSSTFEILVERSEVLCFRPCEAVQSPMLAELPEASVSFCLDSR